MRIRKTFYATAAGTVMLISSLMGCVMGPGSIAAGRGVYNEVINRTEDEQLLNMIVRERYDETSGMLLVASVTANIRAHADLRAQFGLSRSLSEDYAGNLVPLAGGVAYEENPTISYTPLGGERFVQRLLSPLSMEESLLMSQYLHQRRDVYMRIGFKSINGIQNPHVTKDGTGSEAFDRVVHLWQHLRRVGALRIVHNTSGEYEVTIRVDNAEQEKVLEELLELTGISRRPAGGRIVLPIRISPEGQSEEAFTFETRSVMEILRTAGSCIEIPRSHLKAGVVEPDTIENENALMRIRTSRFCPGGAGTIAILYRGWWYYVDDADPASKQAFKFLKMLVGLRLYEQGKDEAAPVLTIPVG